MSDKDMFLMLLKNKNLYKVFVDNDSVFFMNKKELEKYENDFDTKPKYYEFNEFGYELLNEIFQALDIDSELV